MTNKQILPDCLQAAREHQIMPKTQELTNCASPLGPFPGLLLHLAPGLILHPSAPPCVPEYKNGLLQKFLRFGRSAAHRKLRWVSDPPNGLMGLGRGAGGRLTRRFGVSRRGRGGCARPGRRVVGWWSLSVSLYRQGKIGWVVVPFLVSFDR